MDVVLKGRGIKITDQIRHTTEHKLAKIARLDPRVGRLEIEIMGDLNPRMGASHRVEVVCARGRKTFRAYGEGSDVESALDQVEERLQRQITSFRAKRRRFLRRGRRQPPAGTEELGPLT